MSEILVLFQVTLASIDVILFFFCIIGNSVVIYVICRERKLKSKSSFHILSVAVADLLVGFFVIPINMISVSKFIYSSKCIW